MSRILSILSLFLILNVSLYAQQSSRTRMLVLPLQQKSGSGDYSRSQGDSVRDLVFHSIYDFVSLLPFVDAPDTYRVNLKAQSTDVLSEMSQKYLSDIIVFGTYDLQGSVADPEAVISLKLWSQKQKAVIYQQSYTTALDLDIFDTMDAILKVTIEKSLGIKARFAQISIQDFQIGEENYRVLVNNRLVSVVSNRSFNRDLKVLADVEYHVIVERAKDQKIVFEKKQKLKEGDSMRVSYQAQSVLSVGTIRYKEPGKQYKLSLNGEEVAPDTVLSNVAIKMDQNLLVINQNSVIEQRIPLLLKDGETFYVSPMPNWGGAAHMRVYTMGGVMAGLALDYYLARPLWIGLSGGFSIIPRQINNESVLFVQIHPSVELGYHFLGNMKKDFRLGAGVSAGINLIVPGDKWDIISPASNFGLVPAAFVALEWKFVYARCRVVADFNAGSTFQVYPEIGLKF